MQDILQAFQGQLQSLTMGLHFMSQFDNCLAKLSAVPCLHQLRHLQLLLMGGSPVKCRPAKLMLTSLDAELIDWPGGIYSCWDLNGCSSLQTLSLEYYNCPYRDEPPCQLLDLRGITGCRAKALDLRLCVDTKMRGIAVAANCRQSPSVSGG